MNSFHILYGLLLLSSIEFVLSFQNVIIIGAGPAGIAAATKLLENNFHNITIIEAENRIGGRIRSVKFGDAFVDLGAEWCHGQENNIVYEMVKDLDVLEHTPVHSSPMFLSNGEQLDESTSTDLERVIDRDYEAIAKEYNYTLPEDKLTSVESYTLQIYNNTILKKAENNETKYNLLLDAISYLEQIVISLEGSFSWSEASYVTNYQDCEGDPSMTWRGHGFKTIIDVLTKTFPDPSKKLPIDDKVQLNKKVTKIHWNGTDEVLVECSDGSSYGANHVIFTPSIGVLKEQHGTLFVPNLPVVKQEAIKNVGFGGVMKIVLKFSKRWWIDDPFFNVDFIWQKSDKEKSGVDFPHGTIKNGVSWVTQISGLMSSPNNSAVLIAWVTGEWVPEIEKLPSETLKNGAYFTLKKFLAKQYDVEKPVEVIYSTWCSNQNFRGTWSFETVESHKKNQSNQEDLSKPLLNSKGVPVLLFAGESTNPVHYATVQGAIESGYREANRILKLHS